MEKINSEHHYTSMEELLDQGSGTQSHKGEDIFHLNIEEISVKHTGTNFITEYFEVWFYTTNTQGHIK